MGGRGDRAIAWIEHYCRIPEGKLVGEPVRLTDEQKAWLHAIYDTPTRTFILSMARKNAKTAFSAFLLLLHLVGPEAKRNSQLYSAAQSREQAAILFALAAKIVRMSPELSSVVGVRDTAKQLYCEAIGTVYKALSADSATAYGLSPVFCVHDELGQVKGPRFELYDALETASAAQEAPLSVIISTQAPTDADLLSVLIDDAKTGADPRIKAFVYTADMDADPFADDTIRQANPHFDVFMNRDEVRRQAEQARRIPSSEASYRNLILNQRVEAKAPFISRSLWLDNAAEPDDIRHKPLWGGLDLSAVNDLTALVLVSADGDVVPTFWLPSEGLAEKSRSDRVPYDIWAKDGHLRTTPGRSIEYEYIAHYMRDLFDQYDVRCIGFDRYNWRFLEPWLIKAGFAGDELARFVQFGQGYQSMSPALRETQSRLLNRRLRHGNHPVLTMCASNATVVSDDQENVKFTKLRSSGRIDGIVALAMAIGVMPDTNDEAGNFDDFLLSPMRIGN